MGVNLNIMTMIPKPKHCGQHWLEMTPTDGGRICGRCDKKIVDFSKMSWAEIEKIQSQNNNAVCGMYNPKQLDNWGQEIPTNNNSLLKAVAITGLTVSFATSTFGQTINTADSIVIQGKIIDKTTSQGLPFADVVLKNSKVGTMTDYKGNFKLVLRNVPSTPMPDTLEVKYIGYSKKQIIYKDIKEINNSKKRNNHEYGDIVLSLVEDKNNGLLFYVSKPTLRQQIKWKINKWFRRKRK